MNNRSSTRNHESGGAGSYSAALPRLLIIWDSVPHRGAGADLLMRRIFVDYPGERLFALTNSTAARASATRGGVISEDHLFTAPEIQIHRRFLWQISRVLSWLLLPLIVWRGVRLVRRLKIEAIFTVPWNQFFGAAYLVHRITHCPFFFYAMDDPEGSVVGGWLRSPMYHFFMPRAVCAARRLWCVSEGMRESIAARLGKEGLLLLPTADLAEFQSKTNSNQRPEGAPLRIIYTGAIYGMQLDALQRLVRIVNAGHGSDLISLRVSLTLYTSASADYLRKIGLELGANVNLDKVEHQQMPVTLANADILFLPMSFEPGMKHIVSTSIPSKISEYVASGVPILAHGPAYCSAVRYCREFDCGLVVDQPDDAALRGALIRLATDDGLRARLSANALKAAERNHDAPRVVANFLEELQTSLR